MKKLFLSTLFILCLIPAMGQLKHVKGISNIGFTGGITGNGKLLGAGYSHYLQPRWILNVNAVLETGKVESTNLKNFIVSGGVDHTFFEAGESLYLNAGLSLYTGLEKLTSTEKGAGGTVKNYTFGPAGNINVEWYFSSRFLIQIKAEQYFCPLSKLGKWFPACSLSLKYCF